MEQFLPFTILESILTVTFCLWQYTIGVPIDPLAPIFAAAHDPEDKDEFEPILVEDVDRKSSVKKENTESSEP